MIKKEHLVSDISKLKKVYNQSFPWLVTLAEESENAKYFKDALRSLILSRLTEKESTQENVGMAVARRILIYSLTYTISLIYWNIRLRSYRTGHW